MLKMHGVQNVFKQIKDFYGIMKQAEFRRYSRSYLFPSICMEQIIKDIGNDLSIDNEEAWLEQKGIVPV